MRLQTLGSTESNPPQAVEQSGRLMLSGDSWDEARGGGVNN